MNPVIPIAVAVALFALFGSKKTRTRSEGTSADWDPKWGSPGPWDRKYPDADPSRPLPVNQADVDPSLWAKWLIVSSELKRLGYSPVIFEAGRTQRRQAWLYGQGRPDFPGGREGDPVTWTLSSNHPELPARALDVIDSKTGWSDPDFFSALGVLALRNGLKWGGNWTTRDLPHIEL